VGQRLRKPTADDFEFPSDATPEEIEAFVRKQPPIKVETPPEEPTGALRRFGSGLNATANPIEIAKGMYQMVRHPLDTYEGMVNQAANQFVKAKNAYDRGGVSEAVGHTAAGFIPGVGPMAANIADEIVEGDYAGAAGQLTGLALGPAALKGAAKALPNVSKIVPVLERGAAERVADVMTPKGSNQITRRMGAKAAQIAPQILKENRGGWSRTALQEQVLGKLAAAEEALDTAADARNAGAPIETKSALNAIAESRRKLTAQPFEAEHRMPEYTETGNRAGVPIGKDVVPAPNAPRVAQLDQATKEIQSLGEIAPYESLRTIRQAYDGPAKAVYNPSLVDDFLKKTGEAKGAADVTAALRKTLADADPATAEANAQYALYRSASDILEAAEQIEKVKPKVGRQIMARLTATIFGASTAGPAGAAAGYVLAPSMDALVNAGFTTKLKTAQAMQGLADAIKRGDVGRVQSLAYQMGRKAAKARVPALEASREKELAGQE